MVSLARKSLLKDRPRFCFSQAGILFAVSLVTLQLGLLHGFSRSVGRLIDESRADLWVASTDMVNLELSMPIPYQMVGQVQQIDGVARAEGLTVQGGLWRDSQGQMELVRIFGFEPDGALFAPGKVVVGDRQSLSQPHAVMVDATTLDTLNVNRPGDQAQIGSVPATVEGWSEGSQSVVSSAFVFTSLENANTFVDFQLQSSVECEMQDSGFACDAAYVNTRATAGGASTPVPPSDPQPMTAADLTSFVLVSAEDGVEVETLRSQIQASLPSHMQVLTQAEMAQQTRQYWLSRTGIGLVLGLGAIASVGVGMVIIGQILYASVSDHIQEFGTLKAIGASNSKIAKIVLEQSAWMAVIGYGPSMLICSGFGFWLYTTQGILVLITPLTALSILGITVVMSAGSALFAVQKVCRIDPMTVFKA
ncbi:FtsX-like permease family protein [Leptolyngbya iicbica]|uniref:FtsX-like permease family protein n=2 Tax=Cyanophyceae TaxID=3028117 RepID=A0A4Q7EHE4_9CYAN|nr:FtsX-like permease family protein [Leptolyngbya sp. LK]RZM82537.1 FtsX-like permease family protein [Leptolyngbya sp. LK]